MKRGKGKRGKGKGERGKGKGEGKQHVSFMRILNNYEPFPFTPPRKKVYAYFK
jgi:hypothetical protein